MERSSIIQILAKSNQKLISAKLLFHEKIDEEEARYCKAKSSDVLKYTNDYFELTDEERNKVETIK